MTHITHLQAREVLDSRGRPTVEVEVHCTDGVSGRAIVPSGASTGQHEAHELRDGDSTRYSGQGVLQAVTHVRTEIQQALIGQPVESQAQIDRLLCELDGTPQKSRLGANAILGTSLATATAAATARHVPRHQYFRELYSTVCHGFGMAPPVAAAMPLLMVNMISGGLHAGRNLDLQDFLLLPVGAETYRQSFEWIVSAYHRLGALLREQGYEGQLVGDEGGFGPRLPSHEAAFELLIESIRSLGLEPGRDLAIGIDVAASHFHSDTGYRLRTRGDAVLDRDELISMYEDWVEKYPLISIEDGLAEDDWEGWQSLTSRLGSRVQLIGDDFFVTSADRVRRGIREHCANSVLIKVNQVGTLTETLETLATAVQAGYRPVISARSGETEDTVICDLAVGTAAGQLKIGSVARGERLVKYNELLRIEETLSESSFIRGRDLFPRRSDE